MYPRRTLAILLILTVAAAALLIRLRRDGAALDPAAPRRVITQNLDATEGLVLERGGESIEIKRQNGAWDITRPVAVPADAQRVQRFLDALETLPVVDQFSTRSLGQRELTLAQLGLDPPEARVTLHFAGRPATVLDIGHASPSGRALYARLSGRPNTIFVTDAVFAAQMPAAFLEFRQRLLLPPLSAHITALEIQRPGRPTFRVIRKDTLWHLVQPIAGRASQGVVNDLIQALAELAVADFIWPETLSDPAATPGPPDLAPLGLDAASAVSLLIWEQARPNPLRLRVGLPVPEKPGLLHALSTDQATLVTVTNAILGIMGQPPAEFRDKRLFREDPALLATLSIRYPGQTLELECDDDGQWLVTSPVRARANPLMARVLANTILNLRADTITAVENGPARCPNCGARVGEAEDAVETTCPECLDALPAPSAPPASVSPPSQRQLVLAFRDLPPVTLDFQYTPFQTPFTFANDPGVTYLIASSNLPPELVSLDEAARLADPQILDLMPEAVHRLTFATPASTQVFERVETQWRRVGADPGGPAMQPSVLLEDLAGLRAERVAQLTPLLPVQLEALGFSPPALEAVFDFSDDSPSFRRVLSIGGEASPGTRHATVRGTDILYVVSTNALRGLARDAIK
ncbi:MAG: DUF4340 domain-containing protein [Kiritimatiellaeota bacterium]|nr:DUF4340 domain-containing protein [Kiritimatiellota bacterium]